jgi:hypothetical protein
MKLSTAVIRMQAYITSVMKTLIIPASIYHAFNTSFALGEFMAESTVVACGFI